MPSSMDSRPRRLVARPRALGRVSFGISSLFVPRAPPYRRGRAVL